MNLTAHARIQHKDIQIFRVTSESTLHVATLPLHQLTDSSADNALALAGLKRLKTSKWSDTGTGRQAKVKGWK